MKKPTQYLEEQKSILTRIQALHDIIEKHPYLSGMMTDTFHNYLDRVIDKAHLLDDIPRKDWRATPSQEAIDKYL